MSLSLLKTYLLTALAAIFWGANFNLAKPVVAEMHPFIAAATRYLIAAALMLLIMRLKGENLSFRHAKTYLILGIVGVFGFNLLFFLGMQSTSAVNGALIMALNPLLTSLLAFFIMQQHPSRRQLIAFPIGLLGVAVVVLGAGKHLHIAAGDLFILAACLSWAFYNVLAKKLMPTDTSGVASTAGIMTVGALALTIVALLSGQTFITPSPTAGIALVIMSICGGVLSYLFWNAGIAKLGAAQTAIFINLVPVASMLIETAIGTIPTTTQWIGGVLVIGAVTFASI